MPYSRMALKHVHKLHTPPQPYLATPFHREMLARYQRDAREIPARESRDTRELFLEQVHKLHIQTLPTLIIFKDGVTTERLTGFEEIGNKDEFRTEVLEHAIAKYGGRLMLSPATSQILSSHNQELAHYIPFLAPQSLSSLSNTPSLHPTTLHHHHSTHPSSHL